MKPIALFISYLFHPLLISTYSCIILFFGLTDSIFCVFTPLRTKLIISLTVFSFTFLLPVLNLLILYKLNVVSSLFVEKRSERTFPLITTSLCYFGLFYMLSDFNIWPAVKLFVLGGGLCILMAALINLRWQISTHMMGIGGLIGALLAICFFMQLPILTAICICFIVAGAIGFARLAIQAHTPSQVYIGFFVGCFIHLTLFYLAQMMILV